MSSQPSSTDTLLGQGFFYYFYFFLEQCLICIIGYLGSISRAVVAPMSNATTRNMKKMNSLEVGRPGILFDFVQEGGGSNSGYYISGGNTVCILCF